MNIAKDALELTKRFAKGAPCPVNLENIENTMFWPFYLTIATEMGLKEITVRVVKKYWFEIHNRLVVKRFKRGDFDFAAALNCMVRAIKIENEIPACIHGGIVVCEISEYEFEELVRTKKEMIIDLKKGVR